MPTIVKLKYVTALLAELDKPEYKGLSDAECAARMNAPVLTGKNIQQPISAGRLLSWLVANGNFSALAKLPALSAMPDLQLDLSAGGWPKTLQGLVDAKDLTAGDVADLQALGETEELGRSFGEQIGFGLVLPDYVAQIRGYAGMDDPAIEAQLAQLLQEVSR